MKYIIMCGGTYPKWGTTPRQLTEIHGEPIVARTIRLLRGAGVDDIAISTNLDVFEQFGLPLLRHENDYVGRKYDDYDGYWCNCFYQTGEPACYIFGDVVFSPDAIRTIVEYDTDKIMLFGSKAPFASNYPKWYIEPFAFKVSDPDLLRWTIKETKRLDSIGAFHRKPIAWEFWNVASGGDPNYINPGYVAINDYTCDIDNPEEIGNVIIHTPKEASMATKKSEPKKPASKKPETRKVTKKAKPKKVDAVIYKGRTYEVLERTDDRLMLTDGLIHFWAKVSDIDAD